MAHAVKQEDAKEAVIVYMDESFVHQLHGSAYSCFFSSAYYTMGWVATRARANA